MSINHIRGDSFQARVQLRLNGNPLDLTGWTIRCQMRDPNKVLIKDFAPVTEIDLGEGLIALEATFAETKLWEPGTYNCDIEVTSPAGWRKSLDPFTIRVARDITRTEGA